MNGLPNSDQFVFNDPFRFYDDVGSVFAEWLPFHSAKGWSICGSKEQLLIYEFSSKFDDFWQPKPPI